MKARLAFILLAAVALGGCWTRTYSMGDGFSLEADKQTAFSPLMPLMVLGLGGTNISPFFDVVNRTRVRFDEEILATGYTGDHTEGYRLISDLTACGRKIAMARKWQRIGDRKSKWHLLIGDASMQKPHEDVVRPCDEPCDLTIESNWVFHWRPLSTLAGGQPDSVLFILNIRTRQYSRAVVYDSSHWRLEGIGPIRSVEVADNTHHMHCTIRMRNKHSGKRMHILICCDQRQDVRAWAYEEGDPVPDCIKLRDESQEFVK